MLLAVRRPGRRARFRAKRASPRWWSTRCSAPASADPPPAACCRAFAKSTAAFRWPRWWPWICPPACPAIPASRPANSRAPTTPSPSPRPRSRRRMPPNCDHIGRTASSAPIGSPPDLYDGRAALPGGARDVRANCSRRAPRAGHKGTLRARAGGRGLARQDRRRGDGRDRRLRAGAGLVTVASAESAIAEIAGACAGADDGAAARNRIRQHRAQCQSAALAEGKSVVAIGPGTRDARRTSPRWCTRWRTTSTAPWCWTPTRLAGRPRGARRAHRASSRRTPARWRASPARPPRRCRRTASARRARYADGARRHAGAEGQRTVIAFPDGRVWINPTGTPAMGTGGSGDILTGMIAGLLAQFPERADQAVAAAVYLHGLAGRTRRAGARREVPDRHRPSAVSARRHGGVCRSYRTASEEETIALGERLAARIAAPRRGAADRQPGGGQDHPRQGHRARARRRANPTRSPAPPSP